MKKTILPILFGICLGGLSAQNYTLQDIVSGKFWNVASSHWFRRLME